MTIVNSANGISARNGTTTHTISFGFTSTAGNLLVFVVAGAVTHTNAGWTEQLQPVNSGELSVFTKTSTGDSSFTDTVNGSNYPLAWQVWEFSAGSSYVAGVSNNNVSRGTSGAATNWGNTLTGLPGTAVRVIAANSDTQTAGGVVSMSSAWTSPFSGVADVGTPAASGTDGVSLCIGQATGVTATSILPNWSPTWSNGTGTGWSFDMQQILFAIAEPSGGVAASGTVIGVASTRATSSKVVAAAGRCIAVATANAAARKVQSSTAVVVVGATGRAAALHVAPASARSIGALSAASVTKHVAPISGRSTIVGSAAALALKKTAVIGTVRGAVTAVATSTSGSARPAVARCVAAPVVTASTGKIARPAGSVVAAAALRSASTHRTPAAATTVAAATTRAASTRRTPAVAAVRAAGVVRGVAAKRATATGSVVALVTAGGFGGQLGSTRPAVARCVGGAVAYGRFRRMIQRPNSGTTIRPFAGITYRP